MYETREGILKHCSKRNARQLGELGERFLQRTQPSLEAQIADIADAIAYNHHDIDDGLRAGILSIDGLQDSQLFTEHLDQVKNKYSKIDGRLLHAEVIRSMINAVVLDLIQTSNSNIDELKPEDIGDIRTAGKKLITLSSDMQVLHQELKSYLYKNFYRHEKVVTMNQHAEAVIEKIFTSYMSDLGLLPEEYQKQARLDDSTDKNQQARTVCDYIAGMTDRFAQQEFEHVYLAISLRSFLVCTISLIIPINTAVL